VLYRKKSVPDILDDPKALFSRLETAKTGRENRIRSKRNDADTAGMKRNELKLPPVRGN